MFRKTFLTVFITSQAFSSSWWTPDTDTALLIDILATSQQAVKATLDLVETESKMLDRVEKAQLVIEEKHNKVIEAGYLANSAVNLSKNLNGINDVNEYTNKVIEVKNLKDSVKGYNIGLKLSKESNKKSDEVVNNTLKEAIKAKKFKDRVKHKGYSGQNANTKASIDSARNTSALVDQTTSTNIILSQMYAQRRNEQELKNQKDKIAIQNTNEFLRKVGILSSKKKVRIPEKLNDKKILSSLPEDIFKEET